MACIVYRKNNNSDEEWEEFEELYLETIDSNEVQSFSVEVETDQSAAESCESIRIEFGKSTDFYGRIVIYLLEIWGSES